MTLAKNSSSHFNKHTLLNVLIVMMVWILLTSESFASSPVGKPFPSANFNTLDGGLWRTSDFTGRVMLVEFWSTDCVPCLKHVPQLRRLNEKWRKRKDVLLLGVATDKSMAPVKRYAKRHRIKWTQLCAGDKSVYSFLAQHAGVQEVKTPTFWIVDKEGKIAHVVVGNLQKAISLADKLAPKIPQKKSKKD